MPKPYDGVVFDCDATLSALEGIDQLAALAGVAAQVSALTHRAMNGEVPLEAVYGERLALIRPRQRDLANIAQQYLDRSVSGAKETITALQARGVKVAIVSGGILDATLSGPRAEHIIGQFSLPAAKTVRQYPENTAVFGADKQ